MVKIYQIMFATFSKIRKIAEKSRRHRVLRVIICISSLSKNLVQWIRSNQQPEQKWSWIRSLAFFVQAGVNSESPFFSKKQEPDPEFNFTNKSVILWYRPFQAFLLAEQELEFKIFAKTRSGIKLFGVGVESE